MAYDEKTAERVREILSRRRGVVERKMMGTLSFAVDGVMCCCVRGDGLMVRVDASGRERALGEPHTKPIAMQGRVMKSFLLAGAEGIVTNSALGQWIKRGLDVAASSAPFSK